MLIYLYNVNIVKIHVMVFPWSVTYIDFIFLNFVKGLFNSLNNFE